VSEVTIKVKYRCDNHREIWCEEIIPGDYFEAKDMRCSRCLNIMTKKIIKTEVTEYWP